MPSGPVRGAQRGPFAVLTAALAIACSVLGPTHEGAPPRFKPPPRPGSSITHTKMCSCDACEPRACCGGADSEPTDEACVAGSAAEANTETFCDMVVESCTSRCGREVWRVPIAASCRGTRPARCCES